MHDQGTCLEHGSPLPPMLDKCSGTTAVSKPVLVPQRRTTTLQLSGVCRHQAPVRPETYDILAFRQALSTPLALSSLSPSREGGSACRVTVTASSMSFNSGSDGPAAINSRASIASAGSNCSMWEVFTCHPAKSGQTTPGGHAKRLRLTPAAFPQTKG